MSEKSSSVKFNNYSRQMKASLVIYSSFKSIPARVDSEECEANESYTDKCQDCSACSYGMA